MKKSKVFLGPANTANVSKLLAKSLRANGIRADYCTFSTYEHPYKYEKEKSMFLFKSRPFPGTNLILRFIHFVKATLTYNTFIFIPPDTLLIDNIDLPILKLLRKKIIFMLVGCHDRDPLFAIDDPDYICNRCRDKEKQEANFCNDINEKRKRIRKFESYADYIFADEERASFLEKKEGIFFRVAPDPPEPKDYLTKFNKSKIRIVHLPSNPLVKQTHIIEPILKRIEKAEDVEIVIKKETWPTKKILEELSISHILVESLGSGFGMIGIEAVSRGCIVLSSYPKRIAKHYNMDAIYKTKAKTLYDDILFLIHNRKVLKEYAIRSIQFYKKYFTHESVGRYYTKILKLR